MKPTIFFIFFILLVITVSAKPEVQVSQVTPTAGLQVVHPSREYFPSNTKFTLHFHAYNSSNYWLDNSETQCGIHIYNKTGNHIVINETLSFDETEGDFAYHIKPNLLDEGELYTYIVYCNNSEEQGFIKTTFEVTEGAYDKTNNSYWGLSVVVFLGLLVMFFLVLSFQIKDVFANQLLSKSLRLFFFFMSLATAVVGTQITGEIALSGIASQDVSNLLDTTYKVVLWTLVVMMSISVIVGIFYMLEYMRSGSEYVRKRR